MASHCSDAFQRQRQTIFLKTPASPAGTRRLYTVYEERAKSFQPRHECGSPGQALRGTILDQQLLGNIFAYVFKDLFDLDLLTDSCLSESI